MNISDLKTKIRSINSLDVFLIILFIVYLLFPINTPDIVKPWIDSPLGMVVLFILAVTFFIYTNPVLGVLFILVAYELIRRNGVSSIKTTRMDGDSSWYTDPVAYPNNIKMMMDGVESGEKTKEEQLRAMNPKKKTTLEEEIIQERAPIRGESNVYMDTSFKPVADKLYGGASI
jgi:hypothetical protein